MSKKKYRDLSSWIDFFRMLERYVSGGLLQMEAEKHECYVTRAALHAMTPGDDPVQQMKDGSILETAKRLRAYAGTLSGKEADEYFVKPFAVHVVYENYPHDLLYTVLLTKGKHWWQRRDKIEVIGYAEEV